MPETFLFSLDGLLCGDYMRLFNSFQIVAAFIGWPFFIDWLTAATFRGAGVAFYSSCALYVVAFFAMVHCVYFAAGKEDYWF